MPEISAVNTTSPILEPEPKTLATTDRPEPCAGHPLFPLVEFYRLDGALLPPYEMVPAAALPEPFHTMLAHRQDMTPTLEAHHGDRLHLQVLRSFIRGDKYYRNVILRLDQSGQPVEFGANCIWLNHFTCTARTLIIEEYVPLGTLLKDFQVGHENHVLSYFTIQPDTRMQIALQTNGNRSFYGRHNRMLDPLGRPLSEVIEILPPPGRPNDA